MSFRGPGARPVARRESVRQRDVAGADADREAVDEQRRQAAASLLGVGGKLGQRAVRRPRPSLARSAAMIRPRTCRSVPCQACTARRGSPGCDPASRQRQRSASGHDGQSGDRAEQTSAPSSITAAENRAAVAGSAGSRVAISARSAAVAGSLGSSTASDHPGQHPPNVGVHHRGSAAEGERGDGAGGVLTDSR